MGKNTLLKLGITNNPDVEKLQRALSQKGYKDKNGNPLVIDGDFGKNTEYAVKQYQKDKNLKTDGIVGAETWSSLGLEFDNTVELGGKAGTQTVYSQGMYSNTQFSNWRNGSFLSAEAGIAKFGTNYKYGGFAIDAVSANVNVGLNWTYVGFDVGARLVSGEVNIKVIPIPFTNKKIVISGEGELGSIGLRSYWSADESRVKIGISFIVGASVSIGVE